ncbi:MAG TPA: hypothetical protein PKC29_15550 [Thermodesulfobacteriota bacterium]|nr:hypothetical protein [Thermodesulfobacteriota bacterium]
MTHDTIELQWNMDAGRPSYDSDPINPLNRSLARLIDTGKPFSRLALSFLNEGHGLLRWLGVFVQGRRTAFFPGFSTKYDRIESYRGQFPHASCSFEIDHLTLEKDRLSWHVTAPGSSNHIGNAKTLALGDDRYVWFGLSFSSLDIFRPVANNTMIKFQAHRNDSRRRLDAIMRSRDGAEFPILSMPDGPLARQPNSYFHISVIAGPPNFDTYLGPEHGFPIGSPFLLSPFPNALTASTRPHRFNLSENTDLQITLMRLPGILKAPVTFTGQQEPNAALGNNA